MIYQDANGRWRNASESFVDQPGSGPLFEGFPANILR
jgi:hypothetical protein